MIIQRATIFIVAENLDEVKTNAEILKNTLKENKIKYTYTHLALTEKEWEMVKGE